MARASVCGSRREEWDEAACDNADVLLIDVGVCAARNIARARALTLQSRSQWRREQNSLPDQRLPADAYALYIELASPPHILDRYRVPWQLGCHGLQPL